MLGIAFGHRTSDDEAELRSTHESLEGTKAQGTQALDDNGANNTMAQSSFTTALAATTMGSALLGFLRIALQTKNENNH